MPLWVPNAVGILLSLIQLSLIMAYPRVKPTKEVLFEDEIRLQLGHVFIVFVLRAWPAEQTKTLVQDTA